MGGGSLARRADGQGVDSIEIQPLVNGDVIELGSGYQTRCRAGTLKPTSIIYWGPLESKVRDTAHSRQSFRV